MKSKDNGDKTSLPQQDKQRPETKKESDQQKSDPPLTEIKGVTEPEEYVEPKVEEEPER